MRILDFKGHLYEGEIILLLVRWYWPIHGAMGT